MSTLRSTLTLTLLTGLLLTGVPAAAQAKTGSTRSTSGSDRLFLSFIQDATVIPHQWWEGQLVFSDGSPPQTVDTSLINGVFAIQPGVDRLEVGGRIGFGRTDASTGPDGNGATDLDLFAKYYFPSDIEKAEFVVGGIITVPTGDDTAGLGTDAFALAGFGAIRYRLKSVIVTGNIGVQINDDGSFRGSPSLDGKIAPRIAGGVIFPLSDQLTIVGELDFAGKRFEGGKTSSTLLGGINWRVGGKSMLRGAVGVGLSDGSPDASVLVSYAYHF